MRTHSADGTLTRRARSCGPRWARVCRWLAGVSRRQGEIAVQSRGDGPDVVDVGYLPEVAVRPRPHPIVFVVVAPRARDPPGPHAAVAAEGEAMIGLRGDRRHVGKTVDGCWLSRVGRPGRLRIGLSSTVVSPSPDAPIGSKRKVVATSCRDGGHVGDLDQRVRRRWRRGLVGQTISPPAPHDAIAGEGDAVSSPCGDGHRSRHAGDAPWQQDRTRCVQPELSVRGVAPGPNVAIRANGYGVFVSGGHGDDVVDPADPNRIPAVHGGSVPQLAAVVPSPRPEGAIATDGEGMARAGGDGRNDTHSGNLLQRADEALVPTVLDARIR